MRRLAVLASGRGSNLASLLSAFPGDVVLVLSNKADAPALDRAREAGIEALHVPWRRGGGAAFEAEATRALQAHGVDLVLLAGFMRLLSAEFTRQWRGRMLNIHPSLLPDFPGLHAQQQALDAGVPYAGCSVHFVDAGMDTGDVVLQKRVPVLSGDTAEILAARLLPAEHEAYPQAVRLLRRGLAFPRPTPDELSAEFGVQGHATTEDVRVARLLREWNLPDEARNLLQGRTSPLADLARQTDRTRLAWTALLPLEARRACWEGRATLLEEARRHGLESRVSSALQVCADEWERTTY